MMERSFPEEVTGMTSIDDSTTVRRVDGELTLSLLADRDALHVAVFGS